MDVSPRVLVSSLTDTSSPIFDMNRRRSQQLQQQPPSSLRDSFMVPSHSPPLTPEDDRALVATGAFSVPPTQQFVYEQLYYTRGYLANNGNASDYIYCPPSQQPPFPSNNSR